MKSPTTRIELADAIESVVASYMNSVRDTVRQAVEHAFAQPAAPNQASKAKRAAAATPPRATAARRTAAQLSEVCDALCDLVRAQPGASMVELAEQMGAETRSLQRPMAKLKAAGRVRSVGKRHLTRYYPAVVRAAGGA